MDEVMKIYLDKLDENQKATLQLMQGYLIHLKGLEAEIALLHQDVKTNREILKAYVQDDKKSSEETITWLKGLVGAVLAAVMVGIYNIFR